MSEKDSGTDDNRKSGNRFSNFASGISLLLSILLIITTIAYRAEDNDKWDVLNLPSLVVEDCKVRAYEEGDYSELYSRNWGYDPLILPVFSEDVFNRKYRLYNQLIFWDQKKSVHLPTKEIMVTMSDAEKSAKNLGIEEQVKLGDIVIVKHFLFNFYIRNNGESAAKDVDVYIVVEDAERKKFNEGKSDVRKLPELAKDQTTMLSFNMVLDPNYSTTDLYFSIKMSCTSTTGKNIVNEFGARYSAIENQFNIGALKTKKKT